MLWCWHLVWILVRTDHPCLGVGCHSHIRPSLPDPTLHNLKIKNPEDVPIVKEYLDVFPEKLPGMSPNREIEFVSPGNCTYCQETIQDGSH
jgi:hypothetical protein